MIGYETRARDTIIASLEIVFSPLEQHHLPSCLAEPTRGNMAELDPETATTALRGFLRIRARCACPRDTRVARSCIRYARRAINGMQL